MSLAPDIVHLELPLVGVLRTARSSHGKENRLETVVSV